MLSQDRIQTRYRRLTPTNIVNAHADARALARVVRERRGDPAADTAEHPQGRTRVT